MSEEGRKLAAERRNERVELLKRRLDSFLAAGTPARVLEIGCGHGHWLVSLAESEPEGRFVGVDLLSRRIRLAESKATRRNLENVLFLKAEATEVMEAWPVDRPVHRLFLLHPDPWPKKRHAKNRLTGPAFLDRMARITDGGGELYFRTDDEPFFNWSRTHIREHVGWEERDLPWPHEAGSYFRDMLGVHGAVTAVRTEESTDAGSR